MGFTKFGLSEPILQGVYASGYSIPTDIQKQAIPLVLSGRDIIGCAPTGTGKTAAFVLPILHRLGCAPHGNGRRLPRVLVLTPTRELAQQIEESVLTYGTYTEIRPCSIYGGANIMNQMRDLKLGVDIVIATPGRLLDHLHRHTIDLSHIEILVLDEADRMYDMGFINDVRNIIGRIPQQRQTLLFSATMPSEIRSLVASILRNPQHLEIGQLNAPVTTVTQKFYSIAQQLKLDLLVHILEKEAVEIMLVFTRTKHGADKITKRLISRGINATAIHGNRSQSQREHALDGFKQRKYKVLVATDLAARGIDVDGISHVVNYDTPVYAESYIHRIGRTGRAEALGEALTFVAGEEQKYLKRIEGLIGRRFTCARYPGFNYPEESSLEQSRPENTLTPHRQTRRKYWRTPRFA
ncbi:MAG: DEAD/DEAH box helicase [Chitinivibrionales bacterium]|nr:DEAD/DEAH box helicase [Chitinivibrionales bacterium]